MPPTIDPAKLPIPPMATAMKPEIVKNCPVCQYAAPFLERVYQANRAANVTVLGISQDKARDTKDFLREYGVTFPVALDNPAKYTVSNAYGLTNVPTIFYVAPSGEIEVSSVGWSKGDVEAVNQK